jgi:hypothetical protein
MAHYKHALKLRRRNDELPIVIYREDEEGNPIEDPQEICLLYARIEKNEVVLAFDSNNDYRIFRYEVIERGENSIVSEDMKAIIELKRDSLEDRAHGKP